MTRHIDPGTRRRIVDEVCSGSTSLSAAAKRYGYTRQAIASWVKLAGKKLPSPTLVAPRPAQPPTAAAAGQPEPDAYTRAMRAATGESAQGTSASGVGASPAPSPIVPQQSDEDFVLGTVRAGKRSLIDLAVQVGALADGPHAKKAGELTPLATETLRSNLSWLAPELRKHLGGGWDVVIGVLVFDCVVTALALLPHVKRKAPAAPKPEEKKPEAAA